MKKRWAILRWACTVLFVLVVAVTVVGFVRPTSVFYEEQAPRNDPSACGVIIGPWAVEFIWWEIPKGGTLSLHSGDDFAPMVVGGRLLPSYWPYSAAGPGCLHVPLWMPLFLVGAPACFLWLVRRSIRRNNAGACSKCGYDCAGLPAGAACPECGGSRRD